MPALSSAMFAQSRLNLTSRMFCGGLFAATDLARHHQKSGLRRFRELLVFLCVAFQRLSQEDPQFVHGFIADTMFHMTGIFLRCRFVDFQHFRQKSFKQNVPAVNFFGILAAGFGQVDRTVNFLMNVAGILQDAPRLIDAGLADVKHGGDVAHSDARVALFQNQYAFQIIL